MVTCVSVVFDPNLRLRTAEEYLCLLDQTLALGKPWREHYDAGLQSVSVLHAYALLHPTWFPLHATQRAVQWGRSFGPLDLSNDDACQAPQYWGVECSRRDNLEADHAFPYALGGPTEGRNMALLCRMHNRQKAGDVHLYDWPQTAPAWVWDALSRRARLF